MVQERVPPKSKDSSKSWSPPANTKATEASVDEITQTVEPEASKSSSRLNELLNNVNKTYNKISDKQSSPDAVALNNESIQHAQQSKEQQQLGLSSLTQQQNQKEPEKQDFHDAEQLADKNVCVVPNSYELDESQNQEQQFLDDTSDQNQLIKSNKKPAVDDKYIVIYTVQAGRERGTIIFKQERDRRVYENRLYSSEEEFLVTKNSVRIVRRRNGQIQELKIGERTTLRVGEQLLQRRPSNQASNQQKDPEKNLLEIIIGGLAGEFNPDPSLAEIGIDFSISLIPGLDQVADARDLAAHLYVMLFKGQLNDTNRWIALGFTLVGAVPVIGTVIKSLSKYYKKGADEVLQNAGKIIAEIDNALPGISLNQLQNFIAGRWDETVAASKQRWFNFLNSLRGYVDSIPGIAWIAEQKQKASQLIDQVANATQENLDNAFAEIRRIIDDLFEALGLPRTPGGGLATANGAPLGGKLDEPTNQPLRIQGGAGGASKIPNTLAGQQFKSRLVTALQGNKALERELLQLVEEIASSKKISGFTDWLEDVIINKNKSGDDLLRTIQELREAKRLESILQADEMIILGGDFGKITKSFDINVAKTDGTVLRQIEVKTVEKVYKSDAGNILTEIGNASKKSSAALPGTVREVTIIIEVFQGTESVRGGTVEVVGLIRQFKDTNGVVRSTSNIFEPVLKKLNQNEPPVRGLLDKINILDKQGNLLQTFDGTTGVWK